MKYCTQCGNEMLDEAVVCVKCGCRNNSSAGVSDASDLKNNKLAMLLFSIFLGGLGIDRFILGYTGLGILKLLTAGCFGILWIIDIIQIATGKLGPADGSGYTTGI